MSETQGQLTAADGMDLFYRRWAVEGARAEVALVPGYADHSGRYGHVAEFLSAAGFGVWALDLRGHGRSGGARGHVRRFEDYHADLDALLAEIARAAPGRPLFVVGHSMGGLVTLHHALRGGSAARAIAVSSPFLGVALPVPAIKEALGRVMSVVWPGLSLASGINPADLSTDPAVGAAYAADPLVFTTANARWYTEAMRAIAEVKAGAGRIDLPCLVLQAGRDRLADPKASRPLFEALGSKDKRFVDYPEFYHEIFNEREKERPLAELRDWLQARV